MGQIEHVRPLLITSKHVTTSSDFYRAPRAPHRHVQLIIYCASKSVKKVSIAQIGRLLNERLNRNMERRQPICRHRRPRPKKGTQQ